LHFQVLVAGEPADARDLLTLISAWRYSDGCRVRLFCRKPLAGEAMVNRGQAKCNIVIPQRTEEISALTGKLPTVYWQTDAG
jgi:hypothetical protein